MIVSNVKNPNVTVRKAAPRFIVVHYTACLASARAVALSMAKNEVSTHFIVDEKQVIQAVNPTKYAAWHCATSNKKCFCNAKNSNSIGVDICEKKKNVVTKFVEDTDWYFEDGAIQNAAHLISNLMREFNIPIENVVRHYDVTHKLCPRPFVGNDVNEVSGITGEQSWLNFKALIVSLLS